MKLSDLRVLIKEMVQQKLQEGPRDPAIFKAIYMAGGPGSGKSHIVKRLGLENLGFKKIDPDKAYEWMIKKQGHDLSTFDIGSTHGQQIRKDAHDITDSQEGMYINGRLGILFDGTGKNFDKIKRHKEMLESLGYETAMIFVNADIETSLHRNSTRKRKVPTEMVQQFWKDVQGNIGKFQNLFGDKFFIVDNSQNSQGENSADLEVDRIYKKILTWSQQPPRNSVAKRWMNSTP